MILMQSLRLRPHRPLLLWLVPCTLLAFTVHRGFAAVGGLGIMALWSLLLIELRDHPALTFFCPRPFWWRHDHVHPGAMAGACSPDVSM